MEDRLGAAETISVSPEALLTALQAGEYLYDAVEFGPGPIAAAGLVDSADLFVDGSRPALEALAAAFGDAELIDGRDCSALSRKRGDLGLRSLV